MSSAEQAGGRGKSRVGPDTAHEQIAGFEAALRAYLRNQLDFAALRQELEDALYADLSCAPLTLELIEDLYQQGTLPPRPYTALKDDVEKTVAEESSRTEVLAAKEKLAPPDRRPSAELAPTGRTERTDVGGDRTLPIGRSEAMFASDHSIGAAGAEVAADRTLPIERRDKRKEHAPPAVKSAPAAAAPAPKPFEPGHVLRNRFVLQSRIGAGGMGIVYRALDRRKQEAHDGNPYVALKILRHEFRQRPDSLSSLQQEALKAQRLSHPNIVNVFDFDRDGDAVFMTMELLEGESLARLMNRTRTRLPREQAMAIIAGMARGLAYAHEQNIIHYDFKPGNVVLTHDGRIKILDFGIARAAPDEALYTFDSGPLNVMTPAYASCEMLQEGEPDPRDDIYGLACVSYELLAGRHPFNRQSAVRARQQKMKPSRIKGLKRAQWKALERGLRFTRAERTPSAGQFLFEIQGGAAVKPETEIAYAGLVKRAPRSRPRRRKSFGLVAVAVLVAAIAYFADAFLQWFSPERDTPPGEIAAPPADTGQGVVETDETGSAGEPELETMDPVPDPTIVTTDQEAQPADSEAMTPPLDDTGVPSTSTSDASPARPETGPSGAAPSPVAEQPPGDVSTDPPDVLTEQPVPESAAEPATETPPIGSDAEPATDEAPVEPAPAVAPGPGSVGFARRDHSISESGSVAIIEVLREGGSTGEIAVAFATEDGTAEGDRDYGRFDVSILTFAEGETSRQLYVPIVSDALVEDDETFYVTLTNPSGGAELGDATTATVTIVDDDF